MKSATKQCLLLITAVAGASACNSQTPRPTPQPATPAAPAPPEPPTPPPAAPAVPAAKGKTVDVGPVVVGMEEPFKLLNRAAAKTLDEAWKAAKKKQHGEARAAFHALVASYPDKPAARFQELRMAALTDDFAAVPELWRGLLTRDFVAYEKKLATGKEFAALRKSEAWSVVTGITKEVKAAFVKDLDRGFFFVGRLHPATTPILTGVETKLALDQEAYHFDPETKRIRRMSDTGGRVVGLHHDRERGQLLLIGAGALRWQDAKPVYAGLEASAIALDTLERRGPVAIGGDAANVDLCFSEKGEPVFSLGGPSSPEPYTFDATGTSIVKTDGRCGVAVATTRVSPSGSEHFRPDPEGVTLSDDGQELAGVDDELPVRTTTEIRPGSLGWSPGKKRFVYSGRLDRCEGAIKGTLTSTPPVNALYVWDAEKKRAVRIASASASYEAHWIDDDRLVYEAAGPRGSKLLVHDFSVGETVTVNVPAGGGLSGVATVGCQDSEAQALVL
jgi:hypothetical protein